MTDEHKTSHKLTIRILVGMLAGALLGILINVLAHHPSTQSIGLWLTEYGANGLFHIIGKAFVALLQVIVIPLVVVSLTCGTAALDDIRRLGRVGIKTVLLYLMTTAIAISMALAAALLFKPGNNFTLDVSSDFEATTPPSLSEVIINIFPSNIFSEMAEGNMLPIILFSILLGLSISLAGESGKRILGLFNDLNEVIMKLVWVIMSLAPFGVFALIAKTFSTQGYEAFLPLLKYFILVIGVLCLHFLVTYPLMLKLLSGLNPFPFLAKMRNVQIFAFSTASSNATIPINLQNLETRLGVKNSIASFTVPLGATINMDGTAIMQGVATVFIAQVYGVQLELIDLMMIILTATLASIGTAGVPGVGLIMLAMVLTQVGLPVAGISLIIGIDRLLDMIRTAVNVTGDAAVSCIVAKSEGELDLDTFNAKAD